MVVEFTSHDSHVNRILKLRVRTKIKSRTVIKVKKNLPKKDEHFSRTVNTGLLRL